MRIDDFGENADGGEWTFPGGTLSSKWGKMGDHRIKVMIGFDPKNVQLNIVTCQLRKWVLDAFRLPPRHTGSTSVQTQIVGNVAEGNKYSLTGQIKKKTYFKFFEKIYVDLI